MKKLSILAIAFAAVVFAACGGKKSTQNVEDADSLKSFEQQQIEASIKMNLDSLAGVFGNLKQLPLIKTADGKLTLSAEVKKVKPEFLLNAAIADEATTMAEKYRTLAALQVDKQIAQLYDLPVEDYDKAITKLAADINDPSFKVVDNAASIMEAPQPLYDAMNENGRINYFWQLSAAALIEQLFVISQNADKFLSVADDQAADNITFRIVLLIDAVNSLVAYDPDIQPVAEAITSLKALNATSVDELKSQIADAKEDILKARTNLLK